MLQIVKLTPKTFYRAIAFGLVVIMIMAVTSLFSGPQLVGSVVNKYSITELAGVQSESGKEFINCPITFKNEACVRGKSILMAFAPMLSIYNIKENVLVDTTIAWGKQPVCIYETMNGSKYRLTGKVAPGVSCQAAGGMGFWCGKSVTK